jgi:cell division protein DivIC
LNKPARTNVLTLPKEQESKPMHKPPVQKKGGQKRRIKIRNILLFGFLAWGAYVFLFKQSPDLNRLQDDQQRLNAEIEQMKKTNQDLQKKIDHLQDPDYIAELARKKYMMVKDGETLFVEPKP